MICFLYRSFSFSFSYCCYFFKVEVNPESHSLVLFGKMKEFLFFLGETQWNKKFLNSSIWFDSFLVLLFFSNETDINEYS